MGKEPKKRDRRAIRIPVEHEPIPPGRRFFVFEDGRITQVIVACRSDHDAWRERLRKSRPPSVDRTVVCKTLQKVIVATSFIGYDDEPADSDPKPYATLVWGGPLHWRRWHYATLGEAKAGHWKAVEDVRKAMANSE